MVDTHGMGNVAFLHMCPKSTSALDLGWSGFDCSVSDPLQSATTVNYLIFFSEKKIFLHRHMLAGQCCNDCSDQTELGVFDVKLSRMWYLGIDSHKKKRKVLGISSVKETINNIYANEMQTNTTFSLAYTSIQPPFHPIAWHGINTPRESDSCQTVEWLNVLDSVQINLYFTWILEQCSMLKR